jgi:hypothetical protein
VYLKVFKLSLTYPHPEVEAMLNKGGALAVSYNQVLAQPVMIV